MADYLESQELESPAALLERLRAPGLDPAMLATFLDGALNANTGFFRHPGAMNALARQVIPQLYARKSESGPATLRIWSAGCSTGEEAYSIAMALCEPPSAASNGNGNGKRRKKDKSSVKTGGIAENSASACAGPPRKTGPFTSSEAICCLGRSKWPSAASIRNRPLPGCLRRSFAPASRRSETPTERADASPNGAGNGTSNGTSNGSGNGNANNGHLLVKPRLRSLVTFNTMNLTKPVYIGRFDCIFCMDVLPHLSRAQRVALMERLHLYLEPGGYLFLSQTEKLCAPNLNFRSETYDGYTFHRKPLAASAAYGR